MDGHEKPRTTLLHLVNAHTEYWWCRNFRVCWNFLDHCFT